MALASPATTKEKGCTMHSLGRGLFHWVQGPLDAESGHAPRRCWIKGGGGQGAFVQDLFRAPSWGRLEAKTLQEGGDGGVDSRPAVQRRGRQGGLGTHVHHGWAGNKGLPEEQPACVGARGSSPLVYFSKAEALRHAHTCLRRSRGSAPQTRRWSGSRSAGTGY